MKHQHQAARHRLSGWRALFIGLLPWWALANTPPHRIGFDNHETVTATLSTVDINRLVVADDPIQNMSCPAHLCTLSSQQQDQSGAVLLSLNTQVPFVLYVTTQSQKNFGVRVQPQAVPARTTLFEYRGMTLADSAFKPQAPYAMQLATLLKQMMRYQAGQLDRIEGYQHQAITASDQATVVAQAAAAAVAQIPLHVFASPTFTGTVYRLHNQSQTGQALAATAFAGATVRAAAVTQAQLAVGETALLYLITRAGGATWSHG
jgi:conjugal transfer pilus assembly protein TraK